MIELKVESCDDENIDTSVSMGGSNVKEIVAGIKALLAPIEDIEHKIKVAELAIMNSLIDTPKADVCLINRDIFEIMKQFKGDQDG